MVTRQLFVTGAWTGLLLSVLPSPPTGAQPAVAVPEASPAMPGVQRAADNGAVAVPLEPYAGRLVTVSATLRGEKVSLLLDTGGGQTLITPRAAARIGCTPGGRSVGFRMTGERVVFGHCGPMDLQIASRTFAMADIAVWDVMAVLPKDLPPLDGILALDAFVGQPFTLELAARRLTLESARSLERRISGMTRVRARTATGMAGSDLTLFIRGTLGRTGWFLVDSGNLDRTRVAFHMVTPTAAEASQIDSVTLTLEGLPARAVPVSVSDLIYDGVLSEDFLRRWTWTCRLATQDVWATPAR
jgi:hypothetical protein